MWLPKERLFYLTTLVLILLLAVLTVMAEEEELETGRNRENKEGRKRKGKKNRDREGKRRNKHKHRKKMNLDISTVLPTVLTASTTMGIMGVGREYGPIMSPLIDDVLDYSGSFNGTEQRTKLKPTVMRREMTFATARGNQTWPMRELVSVIEGNITLGGLMMVHERDEQMICGKIMPQGGLQVSHITCIPFATISATD